MLRPRPTAHLSAFRVVGSALQSTPHHTHRRTLLTPPVPPVSPVPPVPSVPPAPTATPGAAPAGAALPLDVPPAGSHVENNETPEQQALLVALLVARNRVRWAHTDNLAEACSEACPDRSSEPAATRPPRSAAAAGELTGRNQSGRLDQRNGAALQHQLQCLHRRFRLSITQRTLSEPPPPKQLAARPPSAHGDASPEGRPACRDVGEAGWGGEAAQGEDGGMTEPERERYLKNLRQAAETREAAGDEGEGGGHTSRLPFLSKPAHGESVGGQHLGVGDRSRCMMALTASGSSELRGNACTRGWLS